MSDECDRCSYERSGREFSDGVIREMAAAFAAHGLRFVPSGKVGVPGQAVPVRPQDSTS
jgi:hypothetical protein